jgi:hypothetical protein
MKLSNYQQLLCGMKPKIADAIATNQKEVQNGISKYGDILGAIFN